MISWSRFLLSDQSSMTLHGDILWIFQVHLNKYVAFGNDTSAFKTLTTFEPPFLQCRLSRHRYDVPSPSDAGAEFSKITFTFANNSNLRWLTANYTSRNIWCLKSHMILYDFSTCFWHLQNLHSFESEVVNLLTFIVTLHSTLCTWTCWFTQMRLTSRKIWWFHFDKFANLRCQIQRRHVQFEKFVKCATLVYHCSNTRVLYGFSKNGEEGAVGIRFSISGRISWNLRPTKNGRSWCLRLFNEYTCACACKQFRG